MAVERARTGSQRSQRSVRLSYGETRHRKPLGAKIKDCCRSTIAFIFSNVGVCGLMVGYTIMGAFLFQKIEGPKEVAKSYSVAAYRAKTVERLWNITVEYNTLYPDNWTEHVIREVKEYQRFIVETVGEGWDGTDGSKGPTQWSIEGGFLYSLTVITTIGYGHIVPHTEMGKIVTIFYTIFGMPVFLLYMANMGDILAKSLKWVYAKFCICKKSESQYDANVAWRSADAILRGPAISSYLPVHEYSMGRRNMDDDYAREEDEFEEELYHPREIRTVSGRISRAEPRDFTQYDRRSHDMEDGDCRYLPRRDPDMMYLDDDEEVSIESRSGESHSEKTDIASVNIPISVSLVIMIALLYGGTKLFQSYEGWDGLTSFYFCFISLTTIGFGDYVPGSSVASITSGNRMSFIYCALYLMFGLALLSMCFNLMQEEVVHKFNTCVKSISIGKKREQE